MITCFDDFFPNDDLLCYILQTDVKLSSICSSNILLINCFDAILSELLLQTDVELSSICSSNIERHSIYVGQVDYSTTPEELLAHFESCGTVERVTIVCDKFTGKPKGFAYLEFQVSLLR